MMEELSNSIQISGTVFFILFDRQNKHKLFFSSRKIIGTGIFSEFFWFREKSFDGRFELELDFVARVGPDFSVDGQVVAASKLGLQISDGALANKATLGRQIYKLGWFQVGES